MYAVMQSLTVLSLSLSPPVRALSVTGHLNATNDVPKGVLHVRAAFHHVRAAT